MQDLLIKVIPLNLTSVISPVMLALSVMLMSSKYHPLKKTLVYILGTIIVGVGIIVLGISVAKVTSNNQTTLDSAILDLVLGLFLIYYAVKTVAGKGKERKERVEDQNVHFMKLLLLGIVVNLSNIDGLTLSFLAAREVSEAIISQFAKIILLIINLFFLLLPALLPIALYLFFPKKAGSVLSEINGVLTKYGSYIVGMVFLCFGVYLLIQAWNFFYIN